ncbi:uncharacterized protein V6R79_024405 [Siganus canaliculatus]
MENETLNMDLLYLEGLKVSDKSVLPAFVLLLLIYVFIMVSTLGLSLLILTERSLHQPMYLLLCNMSLNDAFGATVIIPHLLRDVLLPPSERYIHYTDCVFQALCAHIHAGTCHAVLMIMAFDRYVAICNPLHYASIMSGRMVLKLSAAAWTTISVLVLINIWFSVRLTRCRRAVLNPFCDNASLFKLSCEDILLNQIFGLTTSMGLMAVSVCSIIFTYLRIIMVCVSNRNQALNSKALHTCTTHLAVYILLLLSGAVIIVLHRIPSLSYQRKLATIMYHVVPPSLNAVIYGLQIKAVRQKLLLCLRMKKSP